MEDFNRIELKTLNDRIIQIQAHLSHEDNLMHQRITWLWALQGLLFTSYSVLFQKQYGVFPALLICVVGFISCISVGASIRASLRVLDSLTHYRKELSVLIEQNTNLPPLKIPKSKHSLHILYPWRLLPWFIASIWAVIVIYQLSL